MFYKKIDRNSYIISDLHLQHKNLTRGESVWGAGNQTRDFDTTEKMTQAVMDSLQIVPEDSTLFILGDMIFGDKSKFQHYINNIPTKKLVYIFGNHSKWLRLKPELHNNFIWIGDYLEMYWDKTLVCMFHYPISVWNECHRNAWSLVGHSHGSFGPSLPTTYDQGKILDCGWDVHKRPLSFLEVEEIMKKKSYTPVDHHNKATT